MFPVFYFVYFKYIGFLEGHGLNSAGSRAPEGAPDPAAGGRVHIYIYIYIHIYIYISIA